jgi:flavin reductase (DIM6/NTAB) family NADH-FMN oxidoreductase RutF
MHADSSDAKKSIKNGELKAIEPKPLYFGTPVALVGSLNEDGATDLVFLGARMDNYIDPSVVAADLQL